MTCLKVGKTGDLNDYDVWEFSEWMCWKTLFNKLMNAEDK